MQTATQLETINITLEQYESLPENTRAEVFDGQVYYMASPAQIHQELLTELLITIHSYLRQKGNICQVFPAPFDVKLSDSPLTIVQPDILVVCDKNKLDGKRCNGAPDFIIEIISPGNQSDDYIRKLYYYKNAGVREYWIVDPANKFIEQYFLQDGHFVLNDVYSIRPDWELEKMSEEERAALVTEFKCSLYDDLLISLEDVFRRVR